jgi:DNA-binding CsgD family transcriptional regulator
MDLIDLGTFPSGESRFTDFLDQICERLELDHAAYAGTNPVGGSVHGYVNFGQDWKDHYVKNGFYSIDPTLHRAARNIAPVDWRRLERDQNFHTVFRAANDFGISEQGLTIPVRGPFGDTGMLSVTRNCGVAEWDKLVKHIIVDLQSVAVHIHDTVMRSEVLTNVLRFPTLSSREKEVLQWTAAGKSHQDVGDILGISHRTVEVHLRSGRDKLYSVSTAQAVGRAISMGLIYPL